MQISEKIKYVRQKLNLNQREFAKMLNVKPVTLGRYELNERTPDADFLEKFVLTLNINPMWIYYNEGDCFLSEEDLDFSAANVNTLKDLRLILTQDELNGEFNKILISNILSHFQIITKEQSPIYKFLSTLKFEGHLPNRPFLFLYYIFQFIKQDSSKELIENYKHYLLDIIFSYKTLSWNNNPAFTKKIKNEISAKFDDEITEKDCQILVKNTELTIKKLEEIMPAGMMKYHQKIHLKSLFSSKF